MITVTIAYALPEKQWVESLQVPQGTQVEQVLLQCKQFPEFSVLDLSSHKIGIYGHEVPLTQEVKEGDRIEIYRALIRDPKAARRLRAQQKN